MSRRALLTPLLMLLLGAPPAHAEAPPRAPAVLLQLGQEAYDAGRYPEAAQAFEELVRGGHVDGAIYYDLGNAYYRLGEVGPAVLAYRRAALFLPRDGDLAANLDHVRKQVTDQLAVEDEGPSLRALVFWYDRLSLPEQTWLALGLNAIAWTALLLWKKRERDHLPLYVPTLFVATALFAGTAITRTVEYQTRPGGVITYPEVTARSGTDVKSVALFYLHAGAEVTVREPDGGAWVQVELPDGRRGYVESRFVGLVRADAPLPER